MRFLGCSSRHFENTAPIFLLLSRSPDRPRLHGLGASALTGFEDGMLGYHLWVSLACYAKPWEWRWKLGQSTVLEFRIPADTRYIAVVRRGVRNLAESAGFSRDEVADVEVAVSEAVANSVSTAAPTPRSRALSSSARRASDDS